MEFTNRCKQNNISVERALWAWPTSVTRHRQALGSLCHIRSADPRQLPR